MGRKTDQARTHAVVTATTRLVVVAVAGVEYALPMALVRQIAAYRPPRPVPGSPSHIEGVVNLGGRMVPVVSLRALLGVGVGWSQRDARIVVVASGRLSAGLAVDEVREIVIVDTAQCTMFPPADGAGEPGAIGGVARVDGRRLQLLDVPRLLGEPALAA